MASIEKIQSYSTPFKRHLAFLDRNNDGLIYLGESIRGCLSLGLNFPVSLVMAMSIQTIYGNVGSPLYGPLRGIEIQKVTNERYMLQRLTVVDEHKGTLTRGQILDTTRKRKYIDQVHVYGIWALAANQQGLLSCHDLKLCQTGLLLPELEKRRRDRSDVIPLSRGGPISVAGHAWMVKRLFGVRVYQDTEKEEKEK
jgi:Caleosin related protein